MMELLLRKVHRIYKSFVSPLFGQVCRFEPTCSDYAVTALGRHGTLRGCFLTLARIVRCNPWFAGGYDPVPEKRR